MNDQSWIKRIPFRLTPISPLHLGTGEDLDWTSTIVDGDELLLVDLLQAPLDRQTLDQIDNISRNARDASAILKLQQLLARNAGVLKRAAIGAIALPPDIRKDFTDKLGRVAHRETGGGDVVNNLGVARTAHEAYRSAALIPGSSLKGAIRTAWLDKEVKPNQVTDRKKFEALVLGGKFDTDPFRLIKVEDAHAIRTGGTSVVMAHNVRRKSGEAKDSLKVRVEAVAPYQYGLFEGAFRRSSLMGRTFVTRGNELKKLDTPEFAQLVAAANSYHIHLFKDQIAILSKLNPVDARWRTETVKLLQALVPDFHTGNAMLVRLGKFGTAEGKTLNDHREITVRIGKEKKKLKNGTTFWLAGDKKSTRLLPFGWAIIELNPTDAPHEVLGRWCTDMLQDSSFRPAAARNFRLAERQPDAPAMGTSAAAAPAPQTDGEKRLLDLRTRLEALQAASKKADNKSLEAQLLRTSLKQALEMNWSADERKALADIADTLGRKTLKLFDWNNIDQQIKRLRS